MSDDSTVAAAQGVTPAQLAARWGCTPTAVGKHVKRGMPLTSIEAAEDWRRANSRRTPRCKLGGSDSALPSGPVTRIPLTVRADHSIESMLSNAHQARIANYAILTQAIRDKVPGTIAAASKNHSDAISAVMKVEEWSTETLKARGQLVSVDSARVLLNRVLAPIQAAIEGFAVANGRRCNPANPTLAETALSEAIEGIKQQICQALDQITGPPAHA